MAGTERTASPPPVPHASVSPHRTALSSLLSRTCDCTTFQSTVTSTVDSTPFSILQFRYLDSSSPISKSPPHRHLTLPSSLSLNPALSGLPSKPKSNDGLAKFLGH
ncbi:hypothetical protein GQ607_002466 [Colletotrichum asianum]|uniref:Uncharacterized protein n=1 Tax=Colletotrichum asianum TaxID=702518 RepID=A0A8H3WK36_9PEZI|nr:hypothetical protein GQ607_002466 [Colletotrichum asianum]